MGIPPDHIFIACPKCHKQVKVEIEKLCLRYLTCPICRYVVMVHGPTREIIIKAHDEWFAYLEGQPGYPAS